METEEKDLASELAAAWDAAESEDDGTDSEVHQPEGDEPSPAGGETGEHYAEGEPARNAEPVRGEGEQEPAAATGDQPTLDEPPKGLSLEAREAWKETPEAVRQELAKREADYEAGIVKYSTNAKRAEQMDQVLQPYQQLFAMNGGPGNTLPGLLQTASILQMGAPAQKAELLAGLIKQFGVDIRALDNALVGQAPPKEMQQQSQLEQMFNERLGPLQEKLQTYEQREQEQREQQAQQVNSELEEFAKKNEFYPDVKADMADLLDMTAKRGRAMTLDEAYKIACSTHPSISKILAARAAAQGSQTRRAAASSVTGGMGTDSFGGPESIRGALEAAWENTGRV